MKLYLVQHGIAKSKDEDPDRPLTETGWVETKKIATLISTTKQVQVGKIYHSGKTRARQTAEMLAQHLEINDNLDQAADIGPMDDPKVWGGKLRGIQEDIILVGHLPHLTKLASYLLFGDENKNLIQFQNSSILSLERNDNGLWSINYFIVPQTLP